MNKLFAPYTCQINEGVSLPDLYKYHLACHLVRIADWHIHAQEKSWVDLERTVSHYPLCSLPWFPPKDIQRGLLAHPLIGTMISSFRIACKLTSLSSYPCPLTGLWDNPDFLLCILGNLGNFLARERPIDDIQEYQFFLWGKYVSLQYLSSISATRTFPPGHIEKLNTTCSH